MKTPRIFTAPRTLVGVLLILVVLLSACGGVAGDSWAGISSADDLIYVSYGKRVVAINSSSGAIKWEYPPKDNRDANFFAVPTVDDGTIFIGDYKGQMHAIDRDGNLKWIYTPEKKVLVGPVSLTPNDRVISGVAVDSDKVFFGEGSRDVLALSRETGQEAWKFETDHGVWATPLYLPANSDDSNSQPVLYVVSLDHHLYALNPDNGARLWDLDLGGAAPGQMVYDRNRGLLYIGTFSSEMLAVDLSTQSIVDRYATEGWIWDGPTLDGDTLYFGDLSGYLYAVRMTDNGFVQEWKVPVSKSPLRATPLLTDTLVVVGSKDKFVYAVSKEDGSDAWKQQMKGAVLSEMVLVPGTPNDPESPDLVVVGTDSRDELVVALKSDSGDVDWRYSDKN